MVVAEGCEIAEAQGGKDWICGTKDLLQYFSKFWSTVDRLHTGAAGGLFFLSKSIVSWQAIALWM